MSNTNDFREWIEKAEENCSMAQSALRRRKPLPNSSCFHAQQCAEKYLKAMLVAHQRMFSKTHDLVLLNDQCAQGGIFVGVPPKRLNALSDYAVHTRYPGATPTVGDAREAIETAKAVRAFARKFLGIKPQKKKR